MSQHVVILGGGIIALSTALALTQMTRDLSISVVADRFTPNTTSDIAGGYWTPYKAEPMSKILRWSETTQSHLAQNVLDNWPVDLAHVTAVSNEEQPIDLFFKSIAMNYAQVPHGAGRGRHAVAYDAYLARTTEYLHFLMAKLTQLGVTFHQRRVQSLEELKASFSKPVQIIVNCAGLGSRELLQDSHTYPLRGVLAILPPQQHILKRVIDNIDDKPEPAYVISRSDLCVLGGTAIGNDWRETPSEDEINGIIQRCCHLVPELGTESYVRSQVSKTLVGLRPARTSVRLELDDTNDIPVVHNYGHGGSGWTTFWGCATEAANLCAQKLSIKNSKL